MKFILFYLMILNLGFCTNNQSDTCKTKGVVLKAYHTYALRGDIRQQVEFRYNFSGKEFTKKEKFSGSHFMFNQGDSILVVVECKKPSNGRILQRIWNSAENLKTEKQETIIIERSKGSSKGMSYYIVDKKPLFNGAKDASENDIAINKYIEKKVESFNTKEKGVVGISLIINEQGIVDNYRIIKHSSSRLDSLALEIIKEMPNWKPGEHQGEKIKVNYLIEIGF